MLHDKKPPKPCFPDVDLAESERFVKISRPSRFQTCLFVAGCTTALLFTQPSSAQTPKHVLVVSVADGYVHASIPMGNLVFGQLATNSGAFTVDYAKVDQDLATTMPLAALSNYDGVIFQNTSGDIPLPDVAGFLSWIAAGKGFMAVHAGCTGTLLSYPEYANMIGAQAVTHTSSTTEQVQLFNRDSENAACRGLLSSFEVTDEIWTFTNYQSGVCHELLGLNTDPLASDTGDFPLAWCSAYGSGRVIVSALGHNASLWQTNWFQQHLLGGILWMLKLDRGNLPQITVQQPSLSGQPFIFSFDGAAVETYQVQASSNLINWNNISTNFAISNTIYTIIASNALILPQCFYRVSLP